MCFFKYSILYQTRFRGPVWAGQLLTAFVWICGYSISRSIRQRTRLQHRVRELAEGRQPRRVRDRQRYVQGGHESH